MNKIGLRRPYYNVRLGLGDFVKCRLSRPNLPVEGSRYRVYGFNPVLLPYTLYQIQREVVTLNRLIKKIGPNLTLMYTIA